MARDEGRRENYFHIVYYSPLGKEKKTTYRKINTKKKCNLGILREISSHLKKKSLTETVLSCRGFEYIIYRGT